MGKLPKCRSIRDVGANSRENPHSGLQAQTDPSGTFLPGEREPLKGQRRNLHSSSGAHKLVERDSLDQIWFQEAEKPKQTGSHTETPYS